MSYWERPLAQTVEWAQEHRDEIYRELEWCDEFTQRRNETPPPGFCTLRRALRTLADEHGAALTVRAMEVGRLLAADEARPSLSLRGYPLPRDPPIRPPASLADAARRRTCECTLIECALHAHVCACVCARGDPLCVAGASSCVRACAYESSACPRDSRRARTRMTHASACNPLHPSVHRTHRGADWPRASA